MEKILVEITVNSDKGRKRLLPKAVANVLIKKGRAKEVVEKSKEEILFDELVTFLTDRKVEIPEDVELKQLQELEKIELKLIKEEEKEAIKKEIGEIHEFLIANEIKFNKQLGIKKLRKLSEKTKEELKTKSE